MRSEALERKNFGSNKIAEVEFAYKAMLRAMMLMCNLGF